MTAMEEADLIVLTSPNYCMEMSGAMKVLLDHFAYRWVTHRPHGAMFTKVGLTVSSSAGAPANHTTKSLAKQLRWMGVAKGYQSVSYTHLPAVVQQFSRPLQLPGEIIQVDAGEHPALHDLNVLSIVP